MNILTFDIGGTAIKYGVVDETFNIIEKNETPTNASEGGKKVIEKVCSIISTYNEIDAIGISTAGQVNSDLGEIISSTDNIPNYTGTKIKKIIESRFNIPTAVENDVNCVAIGEANAGAGKNIRNFLCLAYGTGIGGAIYLNNNIFVGDNYSAGEFGHIITHAGGNLCTCGQNGCYETYASTRALTKMVKKAIGRHLTGREIFDKVNFENPIIHNVIDLWIDEIVIGLVSIVHSFNPATIIFGGGIMNEKYITDQINEKLTNNIMPSFRNIKIIKAKLGNSAGMIGASVSAMNLLKK